MSFLEPLFLLGILAGALPIAIHLFNRRKAVRRVFPALALLRESDRRTARSVKVRQALLLLMRVLAIALLAIALAKPTCQRDGGLSDLSGQRLPAATVFILDTSASMQHGDWSERARARLDAELSRLRPWDEVALLDSAGVIEDAGLSPDRARVRRALDALEPGFARADLPGTITRASDLLATTQLPARRIIVISDLRRGGWPEGARAAGALQGELIWSRVAPNEAQAPPNLAIVEASYVQDGAPQDHTWRFEAEIKNWGDAPVRDVDVQLSIDGEVVGVTRLEVVEAGASARATLRHRHEGVGVTRAAMTVLDPGAMRADDTYHLTLRLRDRVRALIVNGEPSADMYFDETFFLTRALNPSRRTDSGILPTVITASGLDGATLDKYDVVMLANVARLTQAQADALASYVRGGGGLLISAGDQLDVEAWNLTMRELLPRELRSVKELTQADDPDALIKLTRLGAQDAQHPIFRAFNLPGGATIQATQVYSYMLLEPGTSPNSSILLTYKDAAPALLEREVGRGRVLLWTSTLDHEWTDLPTRPVYLPLLHRATRYLARRATSADAAKRVAGAPVTMEVTGIAQQRLIVRGPEGADAPRREVLEPQDGVVSFTPQRPGLYRVWADEDEGPEAERQRRDDLAISVNIDPAESDLRPLEDDTLAAFGEGEGEGAGQGVSVSAPKQRVNLWPKLLFMVTLLLLLETTLGARRSVLMRLWRAVTGAAPARAT